jgi:hypothetical protein
METIDGAYDTESSPNSNVLMGGSNLPAFDAAEARFPLLPLAASRTMGRPMRRIPTKIVPSSAKPQAANGVLHPGKFRRR